MRKAYMTSNHQDIDEEYLALDIQDPGYHDNINHGPDLSMRARSKALTRERIIQSARTLFKLSGFHKATLRDIAEQAGLSTGAVFANFKDKQDIFDFILRQEMELLKNMLRENYDPEMPFINRSLKQFRLGCEHGQKSYGIFKSVFEIFMTPEVQNQPAVTEFYNMIRDTVSGLYFIAQKNNEIRQDIDIDTVILMMNDLTLSSVRRVFLNNSPIDTECGILSNYIKILLQAIGRSTK